ncbi:MAG TPA: di-heme oxidoredictase family protein [Thermoanaerobaculia bacterium]|nr:di-heme oxidoredictase family protein [Thermoanaerobaculia bacterium]
MEKLKRQWIKRHVLYDGLVVLLIVAAPVGYALAATEAPAGFDNLTNTFESQGQMDLDRANFDTVEQIADGLGPVYNAQACRECHQNPVSGATSQITELRLGRTDANGNFVERPGGSLNQDRAIDPAIQERASAADTIVAFRGSLNVLGDGFVEAIADSTFTTIQNGQPAGMKGQIINVPLLESPNVSRVGRFGWKDQHASLLSFAADAYLNEMGITSPLQPTENTSNGNSVAAFDHVNDPEDADGADVTAFTHFMRSTKVPPRDTALAATADSLAGESLFTSIGCSNCHVTSITTAPAGTVFSTEFTVPAALGDKTIHPFGDFLLHNVGTGDRIVQNGGASTANKLRTPPLWGLRTRARLMHDLANGTRNGAILRHAGEANPVILNYMNLSATQQNQLLTFLNSL